MIIRMAMRGHKSNSNCVKYLTKEINGKLPPLRTEVTLKNNSALTKHQIPNGIRSKYQSVKLELKIT